MATKLAAKRYKIMANKFRQGFSVVTFGLGFAFLSILSYEVIHLARENKALKARIDTLSQEARTPATSSQLVNRVDASDALAEQVTDGNGNIFDIFILGLNTNSPKFYYKDDMGNRLGSLLHLKDYLEGKGQELVFATNAGMYRPQGTPVGLLIINSTELGELNLGDPLRGEEAGNFYLKPNGVFALNDKEAVVMESSHYSRWAGNAQVAFATQSGPMLIIDGVVHPQFQPQSLNKLIRSGVGIIGPNKVVFAISNTPVNFYDFAMLFQQQFKCKNALFLDGVVSRMYLPGLQRRDIEGDFGGIIAVSK